MRVIILSIIWRRTKILLIGVTDNYDGVQYVLNMEYMLFIEETPDGCRVFMQGKDGAHRIRESQAEVMRLIEVERQRIARSNAGMDS